MNNELLTAEEMRKRTAFAESKYEEAMLKAVDEFVRIILKDVKLAADSCHTSVKVAAIAGNIITIPAEHFGRKGTDNFDYIIMDEYDPVVQSLRDLGYKVTFLRGSLSRELKIEW